MWLASFNTPVILFFKGCYLKSATVNLRSNCGMYDVNAFENYRSGLGLESPRPCGLR